MKEKARFDEENAFNLLHRLIRVFPFSIQVRETEFESFRVYSKAANQMAYYFWFSHVFDELDKRGYNIGLKLYRHYNIDTYKQLMEIITNKITNSLSNTIKKPKKKVYILYYDFLFLRYLFKSLFDFLDEINKWLKNEYFGKSYRTIPPLFSFVQNFPEPFLMSNISNSSEFNDIINRIFKYFRYDFIILSADGILRYNNATAEEEEKQRSYIFLHKKKYDNVIEYLDKVDENVFKGDYNNALSECRNALEAFFKRLLLNHKIKEIQRMGKTVKTKDGDVVALAETIRKNIFKIFKFPEYSKNMETSVKSLIEGSKFFISGMANPTGSHGQNKIPKVKLNDAKAAESFLILLINSLVPFEI